MEPRRNPEWEVTERAAVLLLELSYAAMEGRRKMNENKGWAEERLERLERPGNEGNDRHQVMRAMQEWQKMTAM